ncbi:MAG: EAL domain-containing protein (putative c-di-GMP-specific phosphodiesterase class I) [Alteromonadaceae bacterium]|jgi:EAL domain-containing protein (putative c-di-GMP-specific phosphodiesterase class I)/GGDEF domain-containing protein/PAS domain-containing protein|tara:strand:+ start:835 stop:3099 length:2265 start_codon:yes stop_codon:yes gene_type:complete
MNGFIKSYLFRATLFAGLALILGLTLSLIVYNSSTKIEENTFELVNKHIPILNSANQIIEILIEQERNIYEYFTTQDSSVFLKKHQVFNKTFTIQYLIISQEKSFKNQSKLIYNNQKQIAILSEAFHKMVQGKNNHDQNSYWDDLRELLAQISSIRRDMLPALQSIKTSTQQAVIRAQNATHQQVTTSHTLVIFYSFSIILLGGLIAWYIRQSILNNAKMNRLALFPHRNPNPIFSIDTQGSIIFSNPACERLLHKLDYTPEEINRLLPQNFDILCQKIHENNLTFLNVEQTIKDYVLQYNINYLQDIGAYDIHVIDITERKLAEDKVQKLAFYQQTTHLPNQYKLNEDLIIEITQQKDFALSIFSIRNFNQIVTAYGVEASDVLVNEFCENLKTKLTDELALYHLNDNQFALICKEKNNESSLQYIAKTIIDIAEKPLITVYGEFFIELNFGFCLYPEHGKDKNHLIKNAHSALSVAEANQYEYFSLFNNNVEEEILHNAKMIDNLRNAITHNELFLVFQPQLDLVQQKVTGIETLVRWKNGDSIISPAEFIPLAEQSGLIVPIGQWILEKACLFAKKLVNLGYVDIVVAVNVSPRQFSHPDFLKSVLQTLRETKLEAKNLELEITEGVFMYNEEVTLCVLNQLKKNSIQLSIDDFGTGYSSLSYLKRFPIDKLKIDQSFIKDCHNSDEDKAIITTIVALGKNLNLTLIAEGVEELEHVDFLKSINCDEIQGYWYSKPLEQDKLIQFINNPSL